MESETYIPPRLWWLKRIACATAAYLLLLVAVRAWWGWDADRRFADAVEKRRGVGQPVLLEDFVHEPIPDEENGAYFFAQAAQALKRAPGAKRLSDLLEARHDGSDAWRKQVSSFLDANAEVLRLIRRARTCPDLDWKTPPRSPVSRITPPYDAFQRDLASTALLAAVARHRAADDNAAVEELRDALAVGRGATEGTAFGQLTRISIDDAAIAVLEEVTPGLRVERAGLNAEPDAAPASRRQVNELIGELLADEFEQGWTHCLYRERLELMDEAQCLANGNISVLPRSGGPAWLAAPLRLGVWLVKPAWLIDCALIADQIDEFSRPGLHDWEGVIARLPAVEENSSLPCAVARYPVEYPAYVRVARLMYQTLASRRMAATALAIRMHELDNARRPARLADLVPEYLVAVPRDSFARQEQPIRYVPEAPQPLLYSVNLNGLDERGAYALTASGEVSVSTADFPYFLNGDRPRAKHPASAPGMRPGGAAQ